MMYVVWWKYSDSSGAGVLKGFRTQPAAQKFADFMTEHGDQSKYYAVAEIEFAKE